MKSFNPAIYTPSTLAGLDYELYQIQKKIARATFIEAIFGNAGLQIKDKKVKYPQGKKFNQDIDLTFNDQYASYTFFHAKDPININPKTDNNDWTEENVEISQPLSFFFFSNLNKLEVDSSEIVKTCILFELSKCEKLELRSVSEDIDNIWNGFTLTDKINQFSKSPYYCIRVEAILTYMAFPFNGNDQFNPATFDDSSREDAAVNSIVGKTNLS